MSASTDPACRSAGAGPGPWLAAAWRPAGLAYLAVCLAALLVGLYARAVYPAHGQVPAAPVPGLQAVAVGQVLFFLLVHPLIVLRRSDRGQIGRYWAETVAESLTYLVVTTPIYTAAAFLADATATDVLRSAAALGCLLPAVWSAGAILHARPKARPVVVLLMLIAAALPAGEYIHGEFLRVLDVGQGWLVAPVTFAWRAAASRGEGLLPRPGWVAMVHLLAAGALASAGLLGSRRRTSEPRLHEAGS